MAARPGKHGANRKHGGSEGCVGSSTRTAAAARRGLRTAPGRRVCAGAGGLSYPLAVPASDARALRFPPGFRWGVSTSAYQVEGGETPSQWHAWEAAGRIKTGDVRGKACDWWENAERDFDLARGLGLNALRLSLDWARLEPRRGAWDDRAFARYRAMLHGLSERGIRPMITLHHFAHPVWLEVLGGFAVPEAIDAFARFARKAAEELGDACDEWLTFNEPNVFAVQGYLLGEFPPGKRGDVVATLRVLGNLARAHAAAYRAVHEARPGARVGFTQHYLLLDPEHPDRPLDRLVTHVQDALFNDAFPRILETGRAPLGSALATGDTSEARGTCDFSGANLYGRTLLGFDARRAGDMFAHRSLPEGARRGDAAADSPFGEAYPQGLLRAVERLARLGKPIYVLENGLPDKDDRLRPWVVARAAATVHEAIRRGVDVRGYYHWTLVDNFEWAEGWSLRFGLVALDPATGARTPRGSAHLYGAIARANVLTRDDVALWAPEALAEVFP